jgi:hypothetical protein
LTTDVNRPTQLGYWEGISPEGDINDRYKCVDVVRAGREIRVVDAVDAGRFYSEFYK